jgi:hypothetical protein
MPKKKTERVKQTHNPQLRHHFIRPFPEQIYLGLQQYSNYPRITGLLKHLGSNSKQVKIQQLKHHNHLKAACTIDLKGTSLILLN